MKDVIYSVLNLTAFITGIFVTIAIATFPIYLYYEYSPWYLFLMIPSMSIGLWIGIWIIGILFDLVEKVFPT